jgi:hypothetical protein
VEKVFPEITMTGEGVELKLYATTDPLLRSSNSDAEFSVLIDDGYSKIAVAHVKNYNAAVEVIQVVMQGFAALGYELDSVN